MTDADARGRAKNYLGHLLRKDVVLFLHFLRDVTSALSTLSLAMHRREATVADIHSILSTTEKVLRKFRTRYAVSNNLYFSKKFHSYATIIFMFDYSFAEHDQVYMTSYCMFDKNEINRLHAWTKARGSKTIPSPVLQ